MASSAGGAPGFLKRSTRKFVAVFPHWFFTVTATEMGPGTAGLDCDGTTDTITRSGSPQSTKPVLAVSVASSPYMAPGPVL